MVVSFWCSSALNIPYGVLFAVLIGLATLVPYASAVSIVSVSAVLAVQDPRTGLEPAAAAIVVGQIVDQVIQPRLMGSIVGLQPAWLLIALPIGRFAGALYGVGDLLGLLLAVPVASCIKPWRMPPGLATATSGGRKGHAPGAL